MTFKLPESYRAYCTDAAVRTALEHILDSKSPSPPTEIEWEDLPAFHRAVLSAHQVRCEYAIFQFEFWDAVWKPALDAFDFGTTLEPLPVAESQVLCGQDLDTNTIWKESWFGRSFKFATTGFSFVSGVSDDAKKRVAYSFLLRCEGKLTHGLPSAWRQVARRPDWRRRCLYEQ